MNTNLIKAILIGLFFSVLMSCSQDDDFTESIFNDQKTLDPTSSTYNFDVWLNQNFTDPYNLSFQYKMEDVGSDLQYNLVPASLEQSKKLAQLVKYLWFDVYASMVDKEFLKYYGPRIIHLIGSPAYNPNSSTIKLGEAEGGIKITLYNCNNLNYSDTENMNEFYFKTMHHEFMHILHQTKSYPKSFESLAAGKYSPMGWQYRSTQEAAQLGFISPYAGSQAREDFVETIANYLVKSNAQWNSILEMAGQDGADRIMQKLRVCSDWLNEKWQIDLLKMRQQILLRQQNIDEHFFDQTL